ncbi:MAG: transcription termination factor NusA [Holosporales bacterium]|nr:transcription termination factor NusA [Holosporales bacterium]
MSRKIKVEDSPRIGIKNEILQVADIVARDKGIDREEVLEAMEDAIVKTAQMKYGEGKNLTARIDRKSGEIEVFRVWNIVDQIEDEDIEISLTNALIRDSEATIGGVIEDKLPAIEFGRVAAQAARQIIIQRVQLAERNNQYEEFSERVGDIITGIVKRIDFQDIILDIGRTEGIIKRSDIIPNETFKIGDRIKVLLVSLNSDQNGPLLYLSRTHPDFLKKIFEQEVPEIYDGVIKIMGVARDPGSKAKMAVASSDTSLDPIWTCVGVKGSRVQAVVNELKGEKIDIIQWSDNPAIFIVNSLTPAEVSRIVMEESGSCVDAVVPTDQLSAAIGRRGQNVRLASKLTGWNISIVTEEQDAENRAKESARLVKLLTENLDVDEIVAHLLIGEGYNSIYDLSVVNLSSLSSIEGFDDDIASEIKQRAVLFLENKKKDIEKLCKEKGVNDDILQYKMISPELLEALVKAGIKSLDDLGSLSTDELMEIAGDFLNKKESETLIMKIREKWFENEK